MKSLIDKLTVLVCVIMFVVLLFALSNTFHILRVRIEQAENERDLMWQYLIQHQTQIKELNFGCQDLSSRLAWFEDALDIGVTKVVDAWPSRRKHAKSSDID